MSQHGYSVASTSTRKSEKTLLTLKAALSLHQKKNKKQKIINNKKEKIMKTMNATPMTIAQYEHDHVDVVAKCKKAISKFINTYLVFFQMPTGMYVDPEQRKKIWR